MITQYHELPDDPALHEAVETMRVVHKKARNTAFPRPTRGFAGLLSKPLGPLPKYSRIVHPFPEDLKKVRSYRTAGIFLMIGAIVSLISLNMFVPWLSVSPAVLIGDIMTGWLGPTAGSFATCCAIIVLMIFLSAGMSMPRYYGKFWDRAAMFEEQWFRMGAEAWTPRQRVYSCVAFGFMHVTNIVYPLSSLIVLSLVGGVFMAVYLKEYRESGNEEHAVLASAKLHATYNRFAVCYMIVALGIILVPTWFA
jgi:hypothetical protein